MGILDDLVKGVKKEFDQKVQRGKEILTLRKEEKEKFLDLGIEAYVQNIKDTPEIYGELNEENIGTLEMLTEKYQKAVEDADTYQDDRKIRITANAISGAYKKILLWAGAEIRYLKSKGRDVNKGGYLKGARFGAKVPGEL